MARSSAFDDGASANRSLYRYLKRRGHWQTVQQLSAALACHGVSVAAARFPMLVRIERG